MYNWPENGHTRLAISSSKSKEADMRNNTDQPASSQDEGGDFRTSRGEVVRRLDLDKAAGTPSRFVRADPRVAGYEGVELAKAALAGDQAALDEFHELTGLALPGVTEYSEGDAVRLVMSEIDEEVEGLEVQGEPVCQHDDSARAVFQATNESRNNCTLIDASELVAWVLSPEGRAALARRGVNIPAAMSDERMSVTTNALASIANVIGVENCPTPWIENTRDAILIEIRRRAAEAEELRGYKKLMSLRLLLAETRRP